ncbi:MAG: hypothetical protein WBF90_33655 [Rivularia sp. (in: cyanobacteria)]
MGRPFKKIDPVELDKLTNKYSDKEIGELLNHSRWAVTQARRRFKVKSYFEKTGMKKSGTGEIVRGGAKRKFTYDEYFFSEISSEAQAYFLGFLAADGSVDKKLGGVEITLQEKDINSLLQFKKAIGGTSPELNYRSYSNRSDMYRLTLKSCQIAKDLNAWGITPNKTHTLKIVKPIPENLIKHFLRGVWDGDGWIGIRSFELLTASPDFANQLEQWAFDVSGIQLRRRTRNVRGRLYPCLNGNGSVGYPFLKAIYKDCSYFMQRKFDRFSRFCS